MSHTKINISKTKYNIYALNELTSSNRLRNNIYYKKRFYKEYYILFNSYTLGLHHIDNIEDVIKCNISYRYLHHCKIPVDYILSVYRKNNNNINTHILLSLSSNKKLNLNHTEYIIQYARENLSNDIMTLSSSLIRNQDLSEEFIENNIDIFDKFMLRNNRFLSTEFKNKHNISDKTDKDESYEIII